MEPLRGSPRLSCTCFNERGCRGCSSAVIMEESSMFEYFPKNYPWSLAVMQALVGGAMGEIDEACRPLKEISMDNDIFAQQAWHESWKKVAERVEALALGHEEKGQYLSAGRKYLRAGAYYLTGERMLNHSDPRKDQTYRRGLTCFKKGIQFRREPVEWVEIPFQGKSMPALFAKGIDKGRAPCVIHFDGFDVMKEIIYLRTAEEFRKRGLSLLIVDHPGVGEALRLRGMYGDPNTELPAAASVDYLATRPDVDPERIGIVALSLGGYYAPRAAAFEKRLKCCVAWGASWEFIEIAPQPPAGRGGERSMTNMIDQLKWVFGKETVEAALEVTKQMTLKGIADRITCPFLIVHGENDRQVPLWHAEKTFEAAVNSPKRELKVFTLAEGGAEHCQADNYSMAVDYIADWVADILGGYPKGV
jgi:dienelactone hydrolase